MELESTPIKYFKVTLADLHVDGFETLLLAAPDRDFINFHWYEYEEVNFKNPYLWSLEEIDAPEF